MKLTVSLLDSDKIIRGQILAAISETIDKAINKTIVSIRPEVETLLINALQSEPEYSSLMNGELRKEFGIADTNIIDMALANFVNTINITKNPITPNAQGLKGGLTITAIPSSDFGGALGDSSAFIVDDERGYKLPWLEWLLLRGTEIIVRSFDVKYGSNPRSRTGDAIMVSGGNWRVPPAYAGTEKDNWTTRAFEKIDKQITDIIQKSIERHI